MPMNRLNIVINTEDCAEREYQKGFKEAHE